MTYTALHIHTEYSLLDGAIRIKDLFKRAKELGISAVGVAEHGSMAGTIRKYKLAKEAGVKLIIGMECYVVADIAKKDKKESRNHIVLMAKNYGGYKNLIKLSSIASCDGFYYKPRLDRGIIRQYSGGLLCSTACLKNDIAQAIINDDLDMAKQLIRDYIDIFGQDNFFLEVAYHGIPEEQKIADAYFKLAEEFGIRVVFGGDAHYLRREHDSVHGVVLCLQSGKTLSDPKRYKFSGSDYHLLSEDEAREKFKKNPEIFDNANVIADMCSVDFEFGKYVFPDFSVPESHTPESYLRELCYKGLKEKYGDNPEAKKRLDYELSVINKMGFAEYFLIVQDVIVGVSKDEGISTAGRGSCAGSVAGYCLGIHQLEPIKYKLLFERFLNPDRVSLPDIDTDFADRNTAIRYVKNKYGSDKVASIGTYGTLACKLAIKDVARAYGVPFDEVNSLTGDLEYGISFEEAINNPAVVAFFEKHKGIREAVEIIEDIKKFAGRHASGVCWGKLPITEYAPVRKVEDEIVTQYDMEELEAIGLVKFDFLGLDTMDIIRNILKMIGKDDSWLKSISLDDKDTYDMLTSGDSQCVFQLSGSGMVDVLKKVKPICFNDVVAIVSLYRPGSLDYVDTYARRKNGQEQVFYDHPKLESVLKDTYGILIFQESLMELVRVLAGFSNSQADTLRKGVGKKKIELIQSLKDNFSIGCKKYSGMNDGQVNEMWDKILKFANYSFCRAHGCSYALSAYRTAYLRRHYPVEFMTAMVNSALGDADKQANYLAEARRMGIRILPPDINISNKSFVVDQGSIRFGLEGIKNVSGVSLDIIMAKRPYVSYIDFIRKVDTSKVNKRIQMHLIQSGCFDSFGVNRNMLLAGYLDIEPQDSSGNEKQMTLFGAVDYRYPKRHDPTLVEKVKMEKEAMGIPASGDMMDLYPDLADASIPKNLNSGRVRIFGIVKSVRKVFTKKDNREMCFMRLGNKDGDIEVVVFPNQYSVYAGAFYEDNGIVVDGNLQQDGSLILDRVDVIGGI